MKEVNKRKDFPKWKVEQVYIAQDGSCLKCGNSLEHGFHRHHKDGNPSNNEVSNLELLCAECHRATLGDAITEHRKQEEKVLNDLNKLIDECFAGKLSGATVERMMDAITLSLKVSRNLNKLDEGIESPPASIALLKRMQETKILQEAYLEGFKDGVKWLSQNKR
ncbi:MAG: hypothetical protein H3Z53_01940 [archaeon]|nr:hypothetical protein [archaeon]